MATKPAAPQTPVATSNRGIHTAAKDAPLKQVDKDGVAIVKVADRYFKMQSNTLVFAYIPMDFAVPDEWEAVSEDDFHRSVAISMLGMA